VQTKGYCWIDNAFPVLCLSTFSWGRFRFMFMAQLQWIQQYSRCMVKCQAVPWMALTTRGQTVRSPSVDHCPLWDIQYIPVYVAVIHYVLRLASRGRRTEVDELYIKHILYR